MNSNIYLLAGVRTAIGDFGGALKDVAPSELGAIVIREAIERAGIAADAIDHVVMGQVIPTVPQDAYLARVAAIRAGVDAIGTASEEAIMRAMRMTWERMKIVIEPSAAVTLACLLERSLDVQDAAVGIILSGGNVDLERLPWQV